MKIIISFIVLLFSPTFLFMDTFAQSVDLPNNFDIVVYEFGGLYYAKDSQKIIISSDTPDTVIKTALARGGEIYIAGGEYHLSKDFSGFDLKSLTHLKLAANSDIVVTSGYAGYVFRFSNGVGQCVIEGGQILEANPVKRNWIGIMMQGGPDGVFLNLIENMVITNPYIVIDFNSSTGQWVNANTFVNIKGWNFVRGIEFDFKGKHTDDVDGFDGNTFRDSMFQSGSMTTYGAKDIKHQYNAFYNVQFWDLPAGAISSTIDASAKNTIIIGGIMTHKGFVDDGKNTIVLDAWHSNFLSNSSISSDIINGKYQPQVNLSLLPAQNSLNMSMDQQPAAGLVTASKAQLGVSQKRPTQINVYGTVSNSQGGKVILYITRPDGVVEHDETYVTSKGIFYSPIAFDKNSLLGQYKIDVIYQNSNLGSILLNVTSDQVLLPVQTYPNTGTVLLSESNTPVLTLKSNANLWSQGKISDSTFGDSIQYLVKVGIIEKPNGTQTLLHQSLHIPTWFKNSVGWWANGQISDTDLISELQYLLDSGIIQMS